MAKVNTKSRTPARSVSSPVKTHLGPTTRTYEGGAGYLSAPKGELFRLGVNYFAGEGTFYESAESRNARWHTLVEQIAVSDPQWIHGFLTWLRKEGNIRTACVTGAAYAVHARLAANSNDNNMSERGWNRKIVDEVCQRLDEPKEFMAFWTQTYGRKNIPSCVKRGLSDAIGRLTNEYNYMKYGTQNSDSWKLSDVIEMVHAQPTGVYQAQIYKYAVAQGHGNVFDDWKPNMIAANQRLRRDAQRNPRVLLDAERLKEAGFTWEDALSLAGSNLDKGELWDAIIPNMGIFALTRNLRNFEQAGISAASKGYVRSQLEDPEVIAKSRMFPYNIYAAYKNTPGLTFASSLEEAIRLSVSNVPELSGNTLVLSDISASMGSRMSAKSDMSYAEAAAIFAGAIALKNPGRVDFVGYANNTFVQDVPAGGSLLKVVKEFHDKNGRVGGGTETVQSLRKHYDPSKHNRVVIVTDMQAFQDYHYLWGSYSNSQTVTDVVRSDHWLYGFSLGGYQASAIPSGSGTRHEIGGLSDATFKILPLLERGKDAVWPWEQ